MKSRSKKNNIQWKRRASLLGHCLLGTALAAGLVGVRAADEKKEDKEEAPSPEEMFEGGSETYENWVEFSAGGLFTSGNNAQAESRQRMKEGAFGGIEDLHYQGKINKETTFSLDGRALFDLEDYALGLEVRREKLGYLRFHYDQFRTWYNGNGGYYRPGDIWYPLPGSDEALGLDRGTISFEAGLTLENAPEVTFKYTHRFRDGQKGSTSWAPVRADLFSPARGLYPSVYNVDETVDIFELDAKHTIKKTDVGLGLRYETGDLANTRSMTEFFGEPQQRSINNREGSEYDLFSVHAFSETWLKPTLFFSSGFLFSTLDSDTSGSRIYSDFDPNVVTPGLGYTNLVGGGQNQEYVLNLNLMYLPRKDLSLVPSIRVQKKDWDADSFASGTTGTPLLSAASSADGDSLDVTERLDVNYTGLTNWVLYTRGEWTQGTGSLRENGGLEQIAPVTRDSDDERLFQKYAIGARWYPSRKVTIDVGGYYKFNQYDYDHNVDSTLNSGGNRYPAYLVMQDFETYDGNLRLTLRPHTKVTLVTRYEYQVSTVTTGPDSVSGLGSTEASDLTSHIVGQNISWIPWTRLYLQAGINFVFSETETPASALTQAILDSQNNYWTVNFNTGFVVDDRTDLNLGYFYYRADDYEDNSTVGVPFGSGAEEHGITATVTRRLSERVRVSLKYGYFHYEDELYGGNNDSEAHLVFATMQYRF